MDLEFERSEFEPPLYSIVRKRHKGNSDQVNGDLASQNNILPEAETEKYPQTFLFDLKLSSCTVPELGLNPSSGFSDVIRADMTCPDGLGG